MAIWLGSSQSPAQMNIGIQSYANKLVVPPGPTPTLMQETAKKRLLETGAIERKKKMQDGKTMEPF